MNKILTWFIKIWVAFAVLVNVVSIIGLLITANSLWEGWGLVADIYSPFNVINYAMEVVLFSPAIGAYFWLEHRRKKAFAPSTPAQNKTVEIDAGDVIQKYSAVLSAPHKHPLSLIRDISELPYPKAVIKRVLLEVFRRSPADKIDAFKTAYILLADFQELTEEEKHALAATSNLGAELAPVGDLPKSREQAHLIASTLTCLKRVHSRQEKECSEMVQDLKSFGLWNEAAEAKAMSDVVQKMKSKGILKEDENWLPRQSSPSTAPTA